MALKKKPVVKQQPKKYVIEDGISYQKEHTEQYSVMDEMELNQSVRFPPADLKDFAYARTLFHKGTQKRFIIRKVDTYNYRIFRIQDGKVLKTYRKKTKEE